MSDRTGPFGREAVRVTSPADLLALEEREDRSEWFAPIDALIDHLLRRALCGERLIALDRERKNTTVSILGLDAEQRAFVDGRFVLEQQQARGAWFLPEEATLAVGWANLPFHFRDQPRFATGIAAEERGKVALHGSADALFVWAVLEPLFEHLFLPFALRGPLIGQKDGQWQRKAWEDADDFLTALGFEVAGAVAPMRYGGGWSKLRAAEQLRAKQALLEALAAQASRPHAARYRAHQVQGLVTRYYRRMRKEPPKLRQVLTKDLQRVLAGFFDGDWLAFLAYAGEEPHPDERIATALPETRLVVADRVRVAAVAVAQGLPVEEVERALAAFWGTGRDASPVEERVTALRGVWREFDAIHARQAPGMPPLWGLIDDGRISLASWPPYQPGLYGTLLSPALLPRIARLWGTCMLPRWPERVVSAVSPHALMAEAFGPALSFWHGCALTAWFVCEGPSSRTDLPGLADYYRTDLAELDRLGCPVDAALFADLARAEARLGPPEPIPDPARRGRQEVARGVELTIQFNGGTRRAGFEMLRDIISRYRRAWGERHLDAYLRARWESEIRDAARDFGLLHERKGKPPSARQFAMHAAPATNHWFGGDIGGLYRMIGEKAPVEPVRSTFMPADREAFARAVLVQLTGLADPAGEGRDNREGEQARWDLQWMAEESLFFLQREEALDRTPTLDEFGRERFAYRAAALTPEVETAWILYQQAIEAAKQSPRRRADEQAGDPPPRPRATEPVVVRARGVPSDASVEVPDARAERAPFWKRFLRGDSR